MSSEIKKRFLLALAKYLGSNPTEAEPLGAHAVCEPWEMDELLDSIVRPEGSVRLNLDRFNQLMLFCRRDFVTSHFFNYFFGSVLTMEDFEQRIDHFRVVSMLLFGNFKFGHRKLGKCSQEEFDTFLRMVLPRDAAAYEKRDPFGQLEEIAVTDLAMLGYVSEELGDLDFALQAINLLRSTPRSMEEELSALGADKQSRISTLLSKRGLSFPAAGFEGLDASSLNSLADRLSAILHDLTARSENAKAIGERNTKRYLAMPHLDVYVATSMREEGHFRRQFEFTRAVFEHPDVNNLRLRYFDPTLSYVPDRITKGLIECLMMRRAHVTIYNAGLEDSLGKDSELAATLAQGKPVIAYVPLEWDKDEQKTRLDKRANIFRAGHPLGLQIDQRTGVAHGIIVVRTAEQCARMLRKVLLNGLEFQIIHESGSHKLIEKETESVLRVVSDDPELTHAFWTYFHRRSDA